MRRWGRSIAVVVLAGVVTAFVLYGVTSWTPYYAYLGTGVGVRHVSNPGFDPWTGEPHGRIVDYTPIDGSTTRITQEPEDDMIDRRAVPLPVGFALTVFIALIWRTARSTTEADRPSATEPGGHEPVAADGERG